MMARKWMSKAKGCFAYPIFIGQLGILSIGKMYELRGKICGRTWKM